MNLSILISILGFVAFCMFGNLYFSFRLKIDFFVSKFIKLGSNASRGKRNGIHSDEACDQNKGNN